MKLGIMQPYFFPYIGYLQLLNAVDKFVIYDDVNYINKGWINRNNILVNGKPNLFTIPLSEVSQNKKINEISISTNTKWTISFLKTIEHSYKKAPYFCDFFPVIKESIMSPKVNLSEYVHDSIINVCRYLKIDTQIISSSSKYENAEIKSSDRILDICIKENASDYINAIGGMELYNRKEFLDHGIRLSFLKTSEINYSQFNNDFCSGLSIIDVLMFNSVAETNVFLEKYSLL
jgi:hypothetical protein